MSTMIPIRHHSLWSKLATGLTSIVLGTSAQALSFVRGDTYTANYFSTTISHYASSGTISDSLSVSSRYGSEVKGLAFSDDLLYAVTNCNGGVGVAALNADGTVRQFYQGNGYVGGNLSSGQISFGTDGSFYVAAGSNLLRFTTGQSQGTVIYTENQVFDSVVLPSGNVVALSAYAIRELTPDGRIVRTITPNLLISDARGIAYDASTQKLFVTMLGYTNQFSRLLRIDLNTGNVERNTYFEGGDDIFLASDRRLLVGSTRTAPAFFDLDLNPLGSLGSVQQAFVTQLSPIPESSTGTLLIAGLGLLGLFIRRSSVGSLHSRMRPPIAVDAAHRPIA